MEIFDLRDLRLYKVLGANTKQCQEVSRGLKGLASQAKKIQRDQKFSCSGLANR